jgi:hypothetical protein
MLLVCHVEHLGVARCTGASSRFLISQFFLIFFFFFFFFFRPDFFFFLHTAPFSAVEQLADVAGKIRHLEEKLGQLSEGTPEAANLERRLVKLEERQMELLKMVRVDKETALVVEKKEAAQAQAQAAEKTIVAQAQAQAPPAPEAKTLSVDAVNAWLDANPVSVEQPAAPSKMLWWKLGEVSLNRESTAWSNQPGFFVHVGLSGSGKTRVLYEMLAKRFGFYWTVDRAGNGGAEIVSSAVMSLPSSLEEKHRPVVETMVDKLVAAYSILFLQWRRRFPKGTPLEWHVFQTDTKSDVLLKQIRVFLASWTVHDDVANRLLEEATRLASSSLMLVVDEAQVLTLFGKFDSKSRPGRRRSLLFPFVRRCNHFHSFASVWVAGTRLSLADSHSILASGSAKPSPGRVVLADAVFAECDAFSTYLNRVVMPDLEPFPTDLIDVMFARFCGRARPVAVLADYLIASGVRDCASDETLLRERVLAAVDKCESDLLDPSPVSALPNTSIAEFLVKQLSQPKRANLAHLWLPIVVATLENKPYVLPDAFLARTMFDIGVAHLSTRSLVGSFVSAKVFEPLYAKAFYVAARLLDRDGSRGVNPLVLPLLSMTNTAEQSSLGFIVEEFAIPFIHRFLSQSAASESDVFSLRRLSLLDGLTDKQAKVFSPEKSAGPDGVHTFADGSGALGQIKFVKSLSHSEWLSIAKNKVNRARLYAEVGDDTPPKTWSVKKATRLKTKAKLRESANELLDARWPRGYVSYIFTICEVTGFVGENGKKRPMKLKEMVDGRTVYTFSPRLCPELFGGERAAMDAWDGLRAHKMK